MSILVIVIIASIARLAAALSWLAIAFSKAQRCDLPGEPPPVATPATGVLLPAVADDSVPIPVCLGLVVGQHHEADGLVRDEVRSAVETNKWSAEHGELDRELVAGRPVGVIRRRFIDGTNVAVGKCRGVELGRRAGLAVIEP